MGLQLLCKTNRAEKIAAIQIQTMFLKTQLILTLNPKRKWKLTFVFKTEFMCSEFSQEKVSGNNDLGITPKLKTRKRMKF